AKSSPWCYFGELHGEVVADERSELIHDDAVIHVRTMCSSQLANNEGVEVADGEDFGCIVVSDRDIEKLLGRQNEFYRVQSHLTANDRVERPGTMTVPRPDAAHDVSRSAPTR